MAIKYGNSIDLDDFQLLNFVVHNAASPVGSTNGGAMYWDTASKSLNVYDTEATGWFKLSQGITSSTDKGIVLWDGISGKQLSDSSITINDSIALNNSVNTIPVSSIIKAYVDSLVSASLLEPILGIGESGNQIFLDFNTLPSQTSMLDADKLVFRKDSTGLHYTIALSNFKSLVGNSFKTISIEADAGYTWGSGDLVASNNDILEIVAGNNISIQTDAANKGLRISAITPVATYPSSGIVLSTGSNWGTSIIPSTGYLTYNGSAYVWKNETYSLSTHNHDSEYISIVTTPTAGNFPVLTAGGELINSIYNASSFATVTHAHTDILLLKSSSDDVGEYVDMGDTLTIQSGSSNVMVGRTGSTFEISASFSGLTEIYGGAGIEITGTGTSRTVEARIGSNMMWVADGMNLAIDVDPSKVALQTDLHSPVTIGPTNSGLYITGQSLELALVTTTTDGAMSYLDKLRLDSALVTGSNLFTIKGGSADPGEVINQGETITISSDGTVLVGRTGNEITLSASFSGLTSLTEGAGIEITGTGNSRTVAARIGSNMTWVADGTNFAIDIDPSKVALQSDLHNAVTLGANKNGLSITGQVLQLAAATTNNAGAMSATDKTFLDSLGVRLFILKGGSTDTGTDITQGETITISGDATILVGRSGNEITLSASYGGITTLIEGAGIEITDNGSSRTIAARIGSNMAWVVDGSNFAIDINTTTVALKTDLHSAVTIGTANGLSLAATQILSLALATAGSAGAMSAAMYSKLDGLPSSADNYNHWKLADSTYGSYDEITTGETVTFLGTGSATVTRSGSTITIDVSAASETDPVFVASAAYGITSTDISNWNTAYGWGNHASAGYYVGTSTTIRGLFSETVTGLTYTDSTGVLSLTAGYVIPTTTEQSNWNTAYGWGDHSTQGYLTTLTIPTETDPVFTNSAAYSITTTNKNNWNTAYNWGNHATAGYLTTETDPVFNASVAADIDNADITNWDAAYNAIHSPVTIGASANGLNINNQVLTLGLASSLNAGAMSVAQFNKLTAIASNADNYQNWKLADGAFGSSENIGSGDIVTFLGSGAATVTRTDKTITIDVPSSSGIGGSGTSGWIPRFTPDGSTLGNSSIRDNGSSMAVGTTVSTLYKIYAYASNTNASIRGYNSSTLSGSAGVIGEANGSGQGYLSRYDGTRRAAIYGVVGTGSGTKYAGYFSGDVYATGDVYSNSDIRLKKDIQSIEDSLGKIMKLNPVSFKWIADKKGRTNYGIIAQELDTVMPELVSKEDETLTVRYQEFTGVLIAAIQEQQKQIEHLRSEISELKDWRNV